MEVAVLRQPARAGQDGARLGRRLDGGHAEEAQARDPRPRQRARRDGLPRGGAREGGADRAALRARRGDVCDAQPLRGQDHHGGAGHGRRAAVHVEEAQDDRRQRQRRAGRRAGDLQEGARAQRQGLRRRRARLPQRVGGVGADRAWHHADAGPGGCSASSAPTTTRSAGGTSTRRARASSACRSPTTPSSPRPRRRSTCSRRSTASTST